MDKDECFALFNEIIAEENTNNEDDSKYCLITHDELREGYVTLTCGHVFNYVSLFNEIQQQKTKYSYLETTRLRQHQMKCPYCRHVHNYLLPKRDGQGFVRGINSPQKYCLKEYKCTYIMRSGKRKGQVCNIACHSELCQRHTTLTQKNKTKSKCEYILKRGTNKGNTCGKCVNEGKYCKTHLKMV